MTVDDVKREAYLHAPPSLHRRYGTHPMHSSNLWGARDGLVSARGGQQTLAQSLRARHVVRWPVSEDVKHQRSCGQLLA